MQAILLVKSSSSMHNQNTQGFNRGLAEKFNAAIDNLAWIELPLLDRLYTWSNKRQSPTLARLDRVLVNNTFCSVFPNSALSSRLGSHAPLILSIPTSIPKSNRFRFENSWLKNPTFIPAVADAWSYAQTPSDAAGSLAARIKALRGAAKLWSRHNSMPLYAYSNASFIVLLLDLYEEHRDLTAGEQRLRGLCRDQIALVIAQRAAYWKQRGKFRALREGDANTRFFHARASARLRHNGIRTLEVDGTPIVAHDNKVAALTAYYTNILGGESAPT